MCLGSLRDQYDEWLRVGEKTYTAAGNVRAVSKTILCDIVVKAWQSLSADLIIKSFVCCGQVPGVSVNDISCFKDARQLADGRVDLEERMCMPATHLAPNNIDVLDEFDQDL